MPERSEYYTSINLGGFKGSCFSASFFFFIIIIIYFLIKRRLFGRRGIVCHLLHSLPGGSFTGTLQDAWLDQPVTSRCHPACAAEQVMDLPSAPHALEDTRVRVCVCVCGAQHLPTAASSRAEASNTRAASDELEQRASSCACAHFAPIFACSLQEPCTLAPKRVLCSSLQMPGRSSAPGRMLRLWWCLGSQLSVGEMAFCWQHLPVGRGRLLGSCVGAVFWELRVLEVDT